MCEFCTQHGEGKTWYLNAKNYSTELLNDLGRRDMIGHFYEEQIRKGNRQMSLLERGLLKRIDLPRAVREKQTRDMKKRHFGQVLPLEEVEKVFDLAQTITRVACGCKWAKERSEARLCYGITFGTPAWTDLLDMDFFGSPDLARLEQMDRQQAMTAISEADEKGLVHSVWTFVTPFIGAICNCEKQYCLAMRSTVGLKMPSMFRAEYVAAIDPQTCLGCRACLDKCQFAAIEHDPGANTCRIDPRRCYGCGVCRAACPEGAISLDERTRNPVASLLW